MLPIRRAAEKHQAMFNAFIEAGGEIVVRQPAAKPTTPSTAAANVLGARPVTVAGAVVATGVEQTVKAIVAPANEVTTYAQATKNAGFAFVQTSDLLMRVRVEDVLVDPTKPYGKTILETAKDVLIEGSPFQVTGVARGGLAPLVPYILWVGLKAIT